MFSKLRSCANLIQYALTADNRSEQVTNQFLVAPTPTGLAQQIATKYGPLLTLEQVGELVQRPPRGLSMQMSRPEYAGLRAARRRIGRSVRFAANQIAEWIEGCAA